MLELLEQMNAEAAKAAPEFREKLEQWIGSLERLKEQMEEEYDSKEPFCTLKFYQTFNRS